MYKRILERIISTKFFKGKIIIIVGARQTGKTFLSLELIKKFSKQEIRLFNCDNPTDREELANKDLEFLKQLIGKAKVILIDEAQKVENIGETLKLEVVSQTSFGEKRELLRELASSYIYKDISGFQDIKSPDLLVKLLKALALQIGSQVSCNELSNIVDIDKKTIERYIQLLEKNFVIFRLKPFTKNKRREISKLKKIYFYDTGIRNAVINNFNFLDSRKDTGMLWENFMIVERMKFRFYNKIDAEQYFWRNYDGNEIDLIEEESDKLHGYEFKWSLKKDEKKQKFSWLNSYKLIGRKNLKSFVLKK